MFKVTRTLIYEGEEAWVKDTLKKSYLQPDRPFFMGDLTITELERKEEEVEKADE